MKPKAGAPFNVRHLKQNLKVRQLLKNIGDIPINKHTPNSHSIFRGFAELDNTWLTGYPQHEDTHKAKQGGYMDHVKFKDFESVTQKGYAMIQINGTYEGGDKDGEPFSTRFFKSNKQLFGPVKDANAGDILAITFKQNGKFRNAVKIENQTANGTAGGESAGATGNTGQAFSQGPVIQRGTVPDTKHLDAKLATKFYLEARVAKIKPEDISEAFVEALSLADLVQDWRESKGAFSPGMSEGIPGEEDLEDIPE